MAKEKEEKEEKPKKLFTVVHTVWEDGEIDTEMYEFRKNPSGRGAPGKWRLSSKDFNRRVEETLGDTDLLNEAFTNNVGCGLINNPVTSKKITKKKDESIDDINIDPEIIDIKNENKDERNDDNIEFGEFESNGK